MCSKSHLDVAGFVAFTDPTQIERPLLRTFESPISPQQMSREQPYALERGI
jgi:hypothetical protein